MSELRKISPGMYELPKKDGMRVPGLIVATESLLQEMEIEKPLEQVRNVAYLPGIVGYSIAMPDIHWGYGFPIGGVAAMDIETGVISPGGVGYDINCGVRLAIVPRKFKDLSESTKNELINTIFHLVPSGVGQEHSHAGLTDKDYEFIIREGARWSIEQGFGFAEDLNHIESHGHIAGGDFKAISQTAKDRGKKQLGSIGSGNHFIEIGEVSEIFLPEVAKLWGIELEQTYVFIHSGSRGFGHQVCQDTLDYFIKLGYDKGLPDRQLVAAPIHSDAGRKYFQAMAGAANFAFNNRQQILHWVRQGFKKVCGIKPEDIKLVYDVCHNIAKFETHPVNGVEKELCVHRKGATRAFGAGAKELAPIFQKTGQPVLVPGDMGRASYVMQGLGNVLTWSSACHGAGRARSRVQSLKSWEGINPIKHMLEMGVKVVASSKRTVSEEMPDAYKNVDSVVKAVQEAKLANKVAKLSPKLVIKG